MIKYGSNNILIGYLKQLLASTNIPLHPIFVERRNGQGELVDLLENFDYIKNDTIQRYKNKKWIDSGRPFTANKRQLNLSKNFIIKTGIYDTYTHTYLGEYLRFLRDYYHVDLMSMYNCFTNQEVSDFVLEYGTETQNSVSTKKMLDAYDPNYKVYCIPIRPFRKYTIAVDSLTGFEALCGFFNERIITESALIPITVKTAKKFTKTYFSSPVLFEGVTQEIIDALDDQATLNNFIKDLVLILKIPAESQSSIVILEGDYSSFYDGVEGHKISSGYNELNFSNGAKTIDAANGSSNSFILTATENRWVNNYELGQKDHTGAVIKNANKPFIPLNHLQLLQLNTKISYPFADRLIEYLLKNAITAMPDEIPDNIKRIQKTIEEQNCEVLYKPVAYGIWDTEIQKRLYDFMHIAPKSAYGKNKLTLKDTEDCLGFCDKDLEKYYIAKNSQGETFSIAHIDIYGDN